MPNGLKHLRLRQFLNHPTLINWVPIYLFPRGKLHKLLFLFIYLPYTLVNSKQFDLYEKYAVSECKTDFFFGFILSFFFNYPSWLNVITSYNTIFFNWKKCFIFFVCRSTFLTFWLTQKGSLL